LPVLDDWLWCAYISALDFQSSLSIRLGNCWSYGVHTINGCSVRFYYDLSTLQGSEAMRFFYFSSVPIEAIRLGGMTMDDPRLQDSNWFEAKFKDWTRQYKANILEEIARDGQLNPNLALWNGENWRIEPGQARWMALYKLGIPNQKVIAIFNEDEEKHFELLKQYQHEEITTRAELEKCFLSTKWEDHHGLGFFRRKYSQYFQE